MRFNTDKAGKLAALLIFIAGVIALYYVVFFVIFPAVDAYAMSGTIRDREDYQRYKTCQLIEENIDNGFFRANTNKLSCHGVIVHVDTDDYDRIMAAGDAE
ncbi:TPA: hypothetical protein U6I48_004822 [Klebsiella aerogenes]|nr:hypothetical protein [Klebsiella aerogenes]